MAFAWKKGPVVLNKQIGPNCKSFWYTKCKIVGMALNLTASDFDIRLMQIKDYSIYVRVWLKLIFD